MEWKWHQLDHMQIIFILHQTDNPTTSATHHSFFTGRYSSWCQHRLSKALLCLPLSNTTGATRTGQMFLLMPLTRSHLSGSPQSHTHTHVGVQTVDESAHWASRVIVDSRCHTLLDRRRRLMMTSLLPWLRLKHLLDTWQLWRHWLARYQTPPCQSQHTTIYTSQLTSRL